MTATRKYVISFFLNQTLSQITIQPYRSELPDYLLGIIDQVTKFDNQQILRRDFLHYSLQQLIYDDNQLPEMLWLFIDVLHHNHIQSSKPHPIFPAIEELPRQLVQKLELISQAQYQSLNLTCTNILANQLQPRQLDDITALKVITIEQIRLNCEANIYYDHLQFERDLKLLFSWNQAFRARSIRTFAYISLLFEKVIALLTKKDLTRRFYELKQSDLSRLLRYDTIYQLHPKTWPFVPTSFREYQQIDQYVPTPPQRAPQINQRLQSRKEPVQCPPDCVCLVQTLNENQDFCSFSLLSGWETKCYNRVRKIECNHIRQQDNLKCRNRQIQKHERKRCAGKQSSLDEGENQIEERLTWGIDLFTRNVLYHSLPEIDIECNVKINNDARRNYFIQKTLSKAMNFIGAEGYNIVETCKYIMAHSTQIPQQLTVKNFDDKEGLSLMESLSVNEDQEKLFTSRDYFYAYSIIRNHNMAVEKEGFRIHTKGKGAICIDKSGIRHGSFITEYFGELYEPWRWYDRQDFIKQLMKKKKLKNYIPEFYNIYLQKHQDQPLGYDILVVDPSRKGNFSSRFSHSCDPNCGTIITVSGGRYYIGMYSFRDIEYGQQLTFDYCSMTQSNYEHMNSICLCGMKRCRGNYLQLSNSKIFNNLMDNKNCFYTRNSAILKSYCEVAGEEELKICADNNIKEGFLEGTPAWMIKWMARVLLFIEEQGQVYKQSLLQSWRRVYPWDNTESQEDKQKNRQLYSQTSKQDLINLRFQNLITSVDKLKYFFSRNQTNQLPPILVEGTDKIIAVLIQKQDSILNELQQNLIKYKCEGLAHIIQRFLNQIGRQANHFLKLFLFRLCCLVISHKLLFLDNPEFNNQLLSDIVFFYAFTHTYFSPNEYKSFQADEIVLTISQITGQRSSVNQKKDKSRKKYSSPFVWGQMASWYKQTIVCPEASLSQDRRGTLSYPLMKSIILLRKSQYPYDKQSRSAFLKVIQQKPANSWPPAHGCDLSFKNPYKLYGTILFQNVHSKQKLSGHLPCQSLLESCLNSMNSSFRIKLDLFMKVELHIQNINQALQLYEILKQFDIDMDKNVPLIVRNSNFNLTGEGRKKVKRQFEE